MEKKFTVNVAKSRLSVGYTKNDPQFVEMWQKNNVFDNTNKTLQGDSFVLLDGPPYANGEAHLGHGLNKLLKDLVLKSKWSMGQSVSYQPGWDCHGLPLELAVEKKYGKLPYETLKKRCKDLAFRSLVKQRKSFKRLGVLGQWNKPYVTLSDNMLSQTWRTLSALSEKNLLQYKQFPVHYCPACASSLAEAELEDKLLTKSSLYFKVLLNDGKELPSYVLVWTTTPWTLPMNQGLVFNPNFSYELWSNGLENLYLQNADVEQVSQFLNSKGYSFKEVVSGNLFVNTTAVSPLTKKEVPVLPAEFVEEGKTGFVHMACAHGAEDYELGQVHNVQPLSYLNSFGVFDTEKENNLLSLHGMKYTQVAKTVCDLLSLDLVHYSESQTEQQVCWRHKCGVYYNSTWQVFLELENEQYNLKNKVKELLLSSHMEQRYKDKLQQMLLGRKHWCLSRQRQWGCPMNLLVDQNNQLSSLNSVYLSYLADKKDQEALQLLKDNPHLTVFKDVVDVWFDSGNVANEYAHRHGLNKTPTVSHLVLEGKDQFRGWFQSLLWLSVAVNEQLPYKHVFCHGFVLNEQREKFAKSSGNAKPVSYYADTYGSDVLRLWASSQEPETDAVFSDAKLEEMKKYYSRLRLSLRFLTSNLYDYEYKNHVNNMQLFQNKDQFDLHRYVLKEVALLRQELKHCFNSYQFKKGLDALYHFCDKTLSNFYFECLKNTMYLRNLYSEERLMTQTGLYELLLNVFDMVKVYCPFVAEEFYQDYFNSNGNNNVSVFYQNKLDYEKYLSYDNVYDWKLLNDYRKMVQASLEPYQKDKRLKSRTEASVTFELMDTEFFDVLKEKYRLGDLLGVSHVQTSKKEGVSLLVEDLKLNEDYLKCPRCWNYELKQKFKDNLCECCNLD